MRILFTTSPAVGHWFPMLPLARAAQRNGHDVVVTSGPDLEADVRSRGFEFWSVGPSMADAWADLHQAVPGYDAMPMEGRMMADLVHVFQRPGRRRAAALLGRARDWQPDLIVHEIADLAGLLVAETIGVRHVVHGVSPTPPGIEQFFRALFDGVDGVDGSIEMPGLAQRFFDSTALDVTPASLGSSVGLFREVLPVRPVVGDLRAEDALPDKMARLPYDKTVYVTLGTVMNQHPEVFRAVLDGLADLPVNVVATVGPGVDIAAFGPQPRNVVLDAYIPHALVLPLADVVVSHVGSGTLFGALSLGIPQLALPQGADQYFNADALVRSGAGRSLLPPEITPAAVTEAVRALLADGPHRAAANDLRREIAAMPSADDALRTVLAEALVRI